MNESKKDFRVWVKECPEYHPEKIIQIIQQGIKELEVKPKGKIALKPNVVFAWKPEIFTPSAYTHPELLKNTILALAENPEVKRLAITETSAVGVPTRFAFRWAGYTRLVKELKNQIKKPLTLVPMDEDRRVSLFLGGKVHHWVRLSRTFAQADFKVYLPKLKGHCVSRMTGAVKLNIGILSFDDRSLHHDYLLDEKIVDLLSVGWPDLVIMDAITVGLGNEALPSSRNLGLILMGKNPIAVDLVASRLLGYQGEEISYLKLAIQRGYLPKTLDEVELCGDVSSASELDKYGQRLQPYDDEFYRWQDVNKELSRLKAPLKLYHGPYSENSPELCQTGCVMGIKMFLAFLEIYAGAEAFARARPGVFIIGKIKEPVDAQGGLAIIIGNCSDAKVINAGKIIKLRNCFVTASDMFMVIGNRLGIKSPFFDPNFLKSYIPHLLAGMSKKLLNLRYAQDIVEFLSKSFFRKI